MGFISNKNYSKLKNLQLKGFQVGKFKFYFNHNHKNSNIQQNQQSKNLKSLTSITNNLMGCISKDYHI
jgi:hypothetical protein